MVESPGLLRRTRTLTIPVLLAGMLLMAGAEWWRARISDEYAEAAPPDVRALCLAVGAENVDQPSEEQFARIRDLFAAQAREHAAGVARRLYAAIFLEAAGAVFCLLGALPWVLSRPQGCAMKQASLNAGDDPAHAIQPFSEPKPALAEGTGK